MIPILKDDTPVIVEATHLSLAIPPKETEQPVQLPDCVTPLATMAAIETNAGPIVPIPTALSTILPTTYWDESQWAVMFAIMEAAMPAFAPQSTIEDEHNQIRISDAEFEDIFKRLENTVVDPPSKEALREYLAKRCMDDPSYVEDFKRTMGSLKPAQHKALGGILRILTYV